MITLGVYGDRMLKLASRRADGWWPSYFALAPEEAYRKLAYLRAITEEHGRDPDDLEYVYNVTVRIEEGAHTDASRVAGAPEDVAGTLVQFISNGFTLLNLWPLGDPFRQRERLAAEVLPLVRRSLAIADP
jgi:alkanesulfonate monooxygenase SsuD/methylene tetrahydromethanopterin reductase-like flavin-dependent oxidoreductase (luciferase family)